MQVFYIVSKSPACALVQEDALTKIKASSATGNKVTGIFFINEGAQIASSLYETGSVAGKIRDSYIALAKDLNCQLLVCGRAFKTCGFNNSVVKEGFTLSGNTELIAKMCTSDEVVQF